MHASPATFPAALQQLDGQRIAGTSLAIALHLAVAMVLFMPVQQALAPVIDAPPLEIIFKEIIKEKSKPKLPEDHKPRTEVPPVAPVFIAPVEAPPEFIDTSRSEIGLPIVPQITEIGEPPQVGMGFVELQADMAPPPNYPGQAISRNQEGRVVLRVLVDEHGRPTEVAIETSSGFRLLDEAALKIVRTRWHFIPAQRDGAPLAAWALVPIVFQLDR